MPVPPTGTTTTGRSTTRRVSSDETAERDQPRGKMEKGGRGSLVPPGRCGLPGGLPGRIDQGPPGSLGSIAMIDLGRSGSWGLPGKIDQGPPGSLGSMGMIEIGPFGKWATGRMDIGPRESGTMAPPPRPSISIPSALIPLGVSPKRLSGLRFSRLLGARWSPLVARGRVPESPPDLCGPRERPESCTRPRPVLAPTLGPMRLLIHGLLEALADCVISISPWTRLWHERLARFWRGHPGPFAAPSIGR